jgi:NAD(P)-dependent dehydrogenase (short-subunit alcohol dehydrogenase family)
MRAPSPELVDLWLAKAFNAHDVEAAAAMYHPDASRGRRCGGTSPRQPHDKSISLGACENVPDDIISTRISFGTPGILTGERSGVPPERQEDEPRGRASSADREEVVMRPRGTGKVALVTGANRGIGFEIARQLGNEGMTVLVGARDGRRGEEAAERLRRDGIDARPVVLDVTDAKTIEAAARQVEREFGKLDVLVNNAGVVLDRGLRPSEVPLAILRATYETNVFGPAAVTQAFLPLLRKAEAGRVVNATSELGSLARNNDPGFEFAHIKLLAYNSSKTALNAVTVQWAHELRATPIKVNAADPGYTATDFNGHQGTQTVEEGAQAAVRLATLGPDGPTGGFFNAHGPLPW